MMLLRAKYLLQNTGLVKRFKSMIIVLKMAHKLNFNSIWKNCIEDYYKKKENLKVNERNW